MNKILLAAASGLLLSMGTVAQAADGKAIYDQSCKVCHAAGVAGAPKLGDKDAWAPRIAQGADKMLENAINGLNAMPPKGTCMNCSDDDLKAAISYMTAASQ